MSRSAAVPESGPNDLLLRLRRIIGNRHLTSDADLLELVEARLPTDTLQRLLSSGLTDDELFVLVIPRRTLSHRRTRGEALSRDESDRVVRVARIAALGEVVFGARDRSLRWLRTPKQQFGGRSPLELVATEAGARIVEELLYRIDEGMAA